MANTPISGFSSGAPAQPGDEVVIARSGSNFKLTVSEIQTAVATAAIGYTIVNGDDVIATGVAGTGLRIPFACTINSVTLLAAQTGSIVIDIWKSTYAGYPPVVGGSICASAKPTITTSNKSEDTTLTGWTTALSAGDILYFNVDSATTIKNVVLTLKVTKT